MAGPSWSWHWSIKHRSRFQHLLTETTTTDLLLPKPCYASSIQPDFIKSFQCITFCITVCPNLKKWSLQMLTNIRHFLKYQRWGSKLPFSWRLLEKSKTQKICQSCSLKIYCWPIRWKLDLGRKIPPRGRHWLLLFPSLSCLSFKGQEQPVCFHSCSHLCCGLGSFLLIRTCFAMCPDLILCRFVFCIYFNTDSLPLDLCTISFALIPFSFC